MKPFGDRIPAELVFKYFGGKNMNDDSRLDCIDVNLIVAEETAQRLRADIKFLKEEIKEYKIAVSGFKPIMAENKRLKKDLADHRIALHAHAPAKAAYEKENKELQKKNKKLREAHTIQVEFLNDLLDRLEDSNAKKKYN